MKKVNVWSADVGWAVFNNRTQAGLIGQALLGSSLVHIKRQLSMMTAPFRGRPEILPEPSKP